jgi:hypothetical protein
MLLISSSNCRLMWSLKFSMALLVYALAAVRVYSRRAHSSPISSSLSYCCSLLIVSLTMAMIASREASFLLVLAMGPCAFWMACTVLATVMFTSRKPNFRSVLSFGVFALSMLHGCSVNFTYLLCILIVFLTNCLYVVENWLPTFTVPLWELSWRLEK